MVYNDWWSTLNLTEQALWSVAIVGSLLTIIQTILGLTGFDLYDDKSTSVRSDLSNRLFSPTNILVFLTFSSWFTILMLYISNWLVLSLWVGTICGFIITGFIHFLLYTEDKIIDLQETINHTGHVFRSIPPCLNGQGTIQVEIRGTTIELAAVTEGENALPEGAVVKVIEIIDQEMIVVQPIVR